MPRIPPAAGRVGRRMSAPLRARPDYLVIGAQKAGTTSLYRYLRACPAMHEPSRKEIHYFDINYAEGPNWYRSWFPLDTPGRTWVTGEASPFYMLYPHTAARVHAHLPDVRLVALLRHPVDRAYSHFHHSRFRGREDLEDFGEAVRREGERTDAAWQRLLDTGEHQAELQYFTYLRRGLYAEQLQRWLDVFPREALHIVIAEDFFRAPAETTAAVAQHIRLDLPTTEQIDFQAHNTRAYAELPDDLRDELGAYFAEDTRRLEAILGRSTGWTF